MSIYQRHIRNMFSAPYWFLQQRTRKERTTGPSKHCEQFPPPCVQTSRYRLETWHVLEGFQISQNAVVRSVEHQQEAWLYNGPTITGSLESKPGCSGNPCLT